MYVLPTSQKHHALPHVEAYQPFEMKVEVQPI